MMENKLPPFPYCGLSQHLTIFYENSSGDYQAHCSFCRVDVAWNEKDYEENNEDI